MSVITPLNMTKECFNTLTNIYEKKAPTQKKDLKNNLCNMNMQRDETVAYLFTKIAQVKDQLVSISVKTDEDDLLQTIFDGIPFSWETFLTVVNGREEQPNFEKLWHDCIQEEGCIQNKIVSTKEENLSLMERTKKERKLFSPKKYFHAMKNKIHKGFDKSNLICYYCQKSGRFAQNFHTRKRRE